MKESDIHFAVCDYLRKAHKNVIFFTDLSGLKLSIGQAKKIKRMRSSNAIPDLFIAEPRNGKNGFFIELKKSKECVYKKDGSLKKNEHIFEQNSMLENLKSKNYEAHFGLGLDDSLKKIKNYLNFC